MKLLNLPRQPFVGLAGMDQDEAGVVTVQVGRDGWEAQSYLTGETFRSSSR
jgi:hypothetical protein